MFSNPAMVMLLVLCASGYIGGLLYFVAYLAVFRWLPDTALAFRYYWQVVNGVLILIMAIVSVSLDFWLTVAGHTRDAGSRSNDSSLYIPAIAAVPILLSIQRIKKRRADLTKGPPPSPPLLAFPVAPVETP
ncbi:MAG: hypothetical protein K8T20_02740 [Planctomycetes bacterium]|nr:hypothetical protein [Planctomycetota bacterium]